MMSNVPSCTANKTQHPISDYILLKELGKGASGSVYLACHKPDEKLVCIKFIPHGKGSVDMNILKEAATLSKLDHPNIIKYYGSFTLQTESGEALCIVMEYASGGSLRDLIEV